MHLTEEELLAINNKKMATERLEQVKDVFLFYCYTGLSYFDVKQLKNSNIVIAIDGENWISIKRQKTNGASHIPLLPMASDILGRYTKNKGCLNMGMIIPVLSKQKTAT